MDRSAPARSTGSLDTGTALTEATVDRADTLPMNLRGGDASSPQRGCGAPAAPFRFMASMRDSRIVETFHEPAFCRLQTFVAGATKFCMPGYWTRCVTWRSFGVPMNLTWERRLPAGVFQKGESQPPLAGKMPALPGSWSQCMRRNERRLTMNRQDGPSPSPFHHRMGRGRPPRRP